MITDFCIILIANSASLYAAGLLYLILHFVFGVSYGFGTGLLSAFFIMLILLGYLYLHRYLTRRHLKKAIERLETKPLGYLDLPFAPLGRHARESILCVMDDCFLKITRDGKEMDYIAYPFTEIEETFFSPFFLSFYSMEDEKVTFVTFDALATRRLLKENHFFMD